ncbi:MAG: hypothetical protein IJX47_08925 [Clostridia bacterium]|nr:hypothetical protein [Clostridia bacterium]
MAGIRASIEYLNEASENRLTILPPIGRILSAGAGVFLCQLILLAGTNLYTCIFTIPLLLFWGVAFIWFCHIWTSFRFSKAWIITAFLLVIIMSVYCHRLLTIIF